MSVRLRRCLIFVFAPALAAAGAWTTAALAEDAAPAGTVTIERLEWMAASSGENLKWPDAVAYCEGLELGGRDDWRLPSLAELEGLHDADAAGGEGIRSPFVIGDCCLWSGESLVDRPAEDGDEIGGRPEMYHWGFMFDGGLRYYAVHIFEDGRALCTRDVGVDADQDDAIFQ